MNNLSRPSTTQAPGRQQRRRQRYTTPRFRRITAAVYWSIALVVFGAALWVWSRSAFTPTVAVIVGIGGIGCLLGGFLALSGDSDLVYFTGADEAQRAASVGAQAHGFCVAILGLLGLWIAYQVTPAWQAHAALHIGVLMFLALMTYLGSYLIRRQRL
jgi:cell division septal protein FtsQ